ncbi:MAG TPA: sulfite exporter TauE/SafE family protein [Candidatus Polarisedimenticolaceae bacterium]|nr:sulfite exporter TauE/SafE family protein [Candidatus Polarisedimenticolaceae bacterium]
MLGVGVFSGAAATVIGFGIGSLLTPLVAARHGTATAIAAVTIPHALATGLRCWRLRSGIDPEVAVRFGVPSAIGGLAGAWAYTRLGSAALTRALGVLLLLTAAGQLTGWTTRWRPRGTIASVLGLCSGFFGGLAGNQGGLRAGALSGFDLTPAQFVATATVVGLIVDAVRTPVYLLAAGSEIASLWLPITAAAIGVLTGTLLGERVLMGMPPERFRRLLGIGIGVLGAWLVFGVR